MNFYRFFNAILHLSSLFEHALMILFVGILFCSFFSVSLFAFKVTLHEIWSQAFLILIFNDFEFSWNFRSSNTFKLAILQKMPSVALSKVWKYDGCHSELSQFCYLPALLFGCSLCFLCVTLLSLPSSHSGLSSCGASQFLEFISIQPPQSSQFFVFLYLLLLESLKIPLKVEWSHSPSMELFLFTLHFIM